jgi:hypothetical protein
VYKNMVQSELSSFSERDPSLVSVGRDQAKGALSNFPVGKPSLIDTGKD